MRSDITLHATATLQEDFDLRYKQTSGEITVHAFDSSVQKEQKMAVHKTCMQHHWE
jgi:hypothetical protein